jgi:hypothetical protein
LNIGSAASTTLAVNPPDSYVTVGKTLNVTVNVADVVNLTSWQFTLYFSNSILNCTNAFEGPFLRTSGGSAYFNKQINNTAGSVLVYCSLLGNYAASGSGVLTTISFNASSIGDTTLHLNETKLGDGKIPPQPIPHTTIDGTAHVQKYTLTVSTVGSGSVALNNTGPYYHNGEVVMLTATPTIGWSFQNWSGDLIGSVNPATLVITGNMTVTATFTQDQYTLIVNIVGSGSVGKSPNQATYTWGTNVSLTASAGVGWTFAGWSGDVSGTVSPVTVNMTCNKVVNATFTQDQYTLTVSIIGSGSVTLNNSGPYVYGDIVQLTAVPSGGWSFDHWSVDLSGAVSPATIVIDGNKVVNATFTQNAYTLTVNVVGDGVVNRNNTGPYYYGDVVELVAVPSGGWSFDHWSVDLSGAVSPATIVIDGNKVVNATFTEVAVGAHDVAITNVTTSKQGCTPYPTVFQNYACRVFVTVENFGNFTETFKVSAYVNSTAGTFPVAETNVTLLSDSSETITFIWNTAGLVKGNYTVYALAETVANETEIDNNEFNGGFVIVTMIGDITGPTGAPDGKVDIRDVAVVARLFGVNSPNPQYNPNCDSNDDGKIDIKDVSLVSRHFGD